MEQEYPQQIVLGAGTWGYALATVLGTDGRPVAVWDRTPERVERLISSGRHDRLDQRPVPAGLSHLADLTPEAVDPGALIVLGVPSYALRDMVGRLLAAGVGQRQETFVISSKGLEPETNLPVHEILADVLGDAARPRIAILSGPSHAEEVVLEHPTTIVSACASALEAARIQEAFMRPTFRVYSQEDILGVALGGSLKNIYAIAAGVSAGIGFGDNSLAALMTRGIAELSRLGTALGAKAETFAGLAGLGDLIVTCMSQHSRNRRFGELRAKGLTSEQAMEEIGMAVEGVRTAVAAHELAVREGVEMPIAAEIYAVIHDGKDPKTAMIDLMTRDPKAEDTI